MLPEIKIIEKPDWVSWDDIKRCLVDAHAVNRARGINMAHYQWPAEKIREYIGHDGVILVALDGKKVVGTAAISRKVSDGWFAKGEYAYMCFASVLPQYNGQGIYSRLIQLREKIALEQNYTVFVLDTHEKNTKIRKISQSNDYSLVGYFRTMNNDHYNVILAKWVAGCPYSKLYCKFRFNLSWIKAHLYVMLKSVKSIFNII